MKQFKSLTIILLICLSFVFFTSPAYTHPGRTASDGCHYCRTNCSSWGVEWDERHCHGGYTSPSYTPSFSSTDCPANSVYSLFKKSCICDSGYAPTLNLKYCTKIPKNAHVVDSKTDVWLCDDGYKEVNNSCIKKESCENDGSVVFISRVIDGDTVEFSCDGKKEKIRIIGIDTPETVHPTKPVECFGKEASNKMREWVSMKNATLKKGEGSDSRDRYGRLLRYVEVHGEDIGAKMIKGGFAFSYKKYPHEKLEEYNQLEREARGNEAGLWSKTDCDYNESETVTTSNTADILDESTQSGEIVMEVNNNGTNLLKSDDEEKEDTFWSIIVSFFKSFLATT